jgi:tRNA-guanine family transglycosylase
MKLGKARMSAAHRSIPLTRPATGFSTIVQELNHGQRARRGVLHVNGIRLETPALFPVVGLLTGPPSLHRNGAIYKFLKRQLLFEDRRPGVMSEVLHFTDFHVGPRVFREWFPHTAGHPEIRTLEHWVRQSFHELQKPDQFYHPLFFLDSGGFRLLFNREVDIAEYGYQPTQESILQLQLDYGADIVASLDYPVPPFLNHQQARERIAMSVENAVLLMDLLYRQERTDLNGKRPFPILAIHGQTPLEIEFCLVQLLNRLAAAGFTAEPFGVAIGSLVPLRLTNSADRIVMLVKAVVDTLHNTKIPRQFNPEHIPIHAFGVTGDMIPVLTHLGVDTFDSSSYVRSASALDYYDPETWTTINFRQLQELSCDCKACSGITPVQLRQMQDVLKGAKIVGNKERLGLEVGHFTVDIKSDVYGLMAYHNLNLQDKVIADMRMAIAAGRTAEYVVGFSKAHARAESLSQFVAEVDQSVAHAMGHVRVELFPRSRGEIEQHYNTISLTNDPSAFDITQRPDYEVPVGKDRLLLVPCSQAKPYRTSRSHSGIFRFLREHVGDDLERCHKVTISGLYGPVPRELEDLDPVRVYEYVLSTSAKRQGRLVAERLAAYIERYMYAYTQIVAYVTTRAYRDAMEAAFARVHQNYAKAHGPEAPLPVRLLVVPASAHGTGAKDLLNHDHLVELLQALYPEHASSQGWPVQLGHPQLQADPPADSQEAVPAEAIHSHDWHGAGVWARGGRD